MLSCVGFLVLMTGAHAGSRDDAGLRGDAGRWPLGKVPGDDVPETAQNEQPGTPSAPVAAAPASAGPEEASLGTASTTSDKTSDKTADDNLPDDKTPDNVTAPENQADDTTGGGQAAGAPVELTVTAAPQRVKLGEPLTVTVKAVAAADVPVNFPAFWT